MPEPGLPREGGRASAEFPLRGNGAAALSPRWSWLRRGPLLKRWLALWPLWLLLLFPVVDRLVRLALFSLALVLWLGALYLLWPRRKARWALLLLSLAAVVFMLLPGGNVPLAELQPLYTDSLLAYEGTRYVWGGETSLGIDCSGLVRRGMIDAQFNLGLRRMNPALLRAGLDLWWHDCTAMALREGYRDLARPLFSADSINLLDHSRILPGDIAVTADGVHVLAYLGERTWIEADPAAGRVIQVQAPAPDHGWFNVPVVLIRWSQLSAAP